MASYATNMRRIQFIEVGQQMLEVKEETMYENVVRRGMTNESMTQKNFIIKQYDRLITYTYMCIDTATLQFQDVFWNIVRELEDDKEGAEGTYAAALCTHIREVIY